MSICYHRIYVGRERDLVLDSVPGPIYCNMLRKKSFIFSLASKILKTITELCSKILQVTWSWAEVGKLSNGCKQETTGVLWGDTQRGSYLQRKGFPRWWTGADRGPSEVQGEGEEEEGKRETMGGWTTEGWKEVGDSRCWRRLLLPWQRSWAGDQILPTEEGGVKDRMKKGGREEVEDRGMCVFV